MMLHVSDLQWTMARSMKQLQIADALIMWLTDKPAGAVISPANLANSGLAFMSVMLSQAWPCYA